jgi:predicted ATPase/DNA-binding CsgD family transcriptional regulator
MEISDVLPWKETLSPREIEILRLVAEGLTNREISQKLHLTIETIKWYNKQIFSKLGAKNRTQAAKLANEFGLLDPDSKKTALIEKQPRLLSNLPAQLTSFVGRKNEINEIEELLKTSRLLALTGAGGMGKSRLSLQVGGELLENYRDGVWLVELSAINDPKLVPNAIANALKVDISRSNNVIEDLKRYIKRKHLLLIIDNFEHLLEAAPLVGELLAAAPLLTVLVTSRELIKVYGEHEYLVQPLKLPDINRKETTENLLKYEAINLFIQRARAAHPKLVFDEDEMSAVVQICARLDGLPLAIELAASQIKIYPPSLLAIRMENSLDTLSSGPINLPERQQTLRATLDWSYDLLQEDEQILFARLAVFNGGGILEAIERICGKGLSGNVSDLLVSLVNKNLVILSERRDGELQFKMLDTILEYCKEKLALSEEVEEIHLLHASYYADLGEEANSEILGTKHKYWFQRFQTEQDNFHSAIAWSLLGHEHIFGLRIAANLKYFWIYKGLAADGLRWVMLALEKDNNQTLELRADLLTSASLLSNYTFTKQNAEKKLVEAIDIYEQLGDERKKAWALSYLSLLSDQMSAAEIQNRLELAHESLAIFDRLGDKPGLAYTNNILGELSRMNKDYISAKGYYETALDIVKQTGERNREGINYVNLGFIAFHEKEYHLAEQYTKQSLSIFLELNSFYGLATHLSTLAGPTAALGFPKKAARLLGAANEELELLNIKHGIADLPEIKFFYDNVYQILGEKMFKEAWEEGQRMTVQEAVAYALKDADAEE